MPSRSRPVFCFSGVDTVVTKDDGEVPMRELKIGQEVMVGDNIFEKVYGFGHYHNSLDAEFLQIHLQSTQTPLELSASHMVFVKDNHSIPASLLKRGDNVMLGNGGEAGVVSINHVVRKGVFAPFTPSGKIVVNGVLASTFVAMQESSHLTIGKKATPWSLQWLALTFEAPHRVYCALASSGCEDEAYSEEGLSVWVAYPFRFSEWLVEQNDIVVVLVMLPLALLFSVFSVVEALLLNGALGVVAVLSVLMLISREKRLK